MCLMTKARVIYFITPKKNTHFNSDHDKVFFQSLGIHESPDYKPSHIIGCALITKCMDTNSFIPTLTKPHIQWYQKVSKKYKFAWIFDEWRKLDKQYQSPIRGNTNLLNIDSILDQIKKNNDFIKKYDEIYNTTHRALVVDSRMIKAMELQEKLYELRSKKLRI